MRAAAALVRARGAPLALLAACCSACAPSAFDQPSGRSELGKESVECPEDEGEPCASELQRDAMTEAEPDAESELEPEPDPDPDPDPDPATDACASCSEDDAALSELDADVCTSCAQPADAGLCLDDAGAMCRPDAGSCGGAAPVCMAGQLQKEQRACGACNTGNQARTRSCTPDGCGWGAWSAWSGCTGVTAACTPNQTTSCSNGDDCGQRVCSDACTWGACEPKVAGGCLRIGEGHTDQGSNYRCCNGGKHWQFCLPDCHWSTDCSPCTQGAPNFCSDCY